MKKLDDIKLEELEKEYFDQIYYSVAHNRQRMMDGLTSKDKIKTYWLDKFVRTDKKRQTSDMAVGAERIFHWLISATHWTPNSAPIGADLFFESHNAFIHLEIKTARENNKSDFRGIVPLGKNQTSYKPTHSYMGKLIKTKPNLPEFYGNEKLCLTYAIQIIYDHKTFEIIAILLVSIPNGKLFKIYGNKIANCGKTKDESFRYRYRSNPYFELLPSKPYRIKFIYYKKNPNLSEEKITANSDIRYLPDQNNSESI